MAVPFYDFKKLHDDKLKKEILGMFEEIITESSFVEGKYNTLFEQEFAKKQQANHCLLVANGTDAIEICLQALGIGKGDKVGVPGITFIASAEAVLNVGAEPVLIDVNQITGLMCPKSLQRVLNKTFLKAIIPVHIYGMPAPIAELENICTPRNIKIIEDAAQAHGTLLSPHQPVGSSKNLTTFSFYPTKNLGAFGDAGAITTQDLELANKIKTLRNHGRNPHGPNLFGRNSRCDHMQAAVLYAKLKDLDANNERRKVIASKYISSLSTLNIKIPGESLLNSSSWHLFPILVSSLEQKKALLSFLQQKSISAVAFYEKALCEEVPLENCLGESQHSLVFSKNVLCLPIHPTMSMLDVEEVVSAISDFLK